MATTAPPRRFKVEPLETTVKSSKDRLQEEYSEKPRPVRRFAPEPIETTTKSSKDKQQDEHLEKPKPVRRFAPEPIETTTKSSKDRPQEEPLEKPKPIRRFAPEPVETTTKSSKDREPLENPKPIRRFAPEPIETSAKSSKDRPQEEQSERPKPTRRFAPEPIETTTTKKKTNRLRFAPEPIETTSRSSRQKFAKEWDEQTSPTAKRSKYDQEDMTASDNRKHKSALKRPTKTFAPQLIETAQRSRKAGDTSPTLLPSDKTEVTSDEIISARKARILGIPPAPPTNTPTVDVSQNPLFLEIRRNAPPLSRRRSYFSSSQHSFRVPDLDPIESSESDGSSPPSPIHTPLPTSDFSFMYKEATRRRESVDPGSSGYLLALAAKAAEKQLREQAMAAFPNDDYHETVDHFVDRDTDESESSIDEAKRGRESSYTQVNWELEAMQKYHEQQRAEKNKRKPSLSSQQKEQAKPAFNPFGKPPGFLDAATAKKLADERKDPELERMRKGARPPMLGDDITFPRCPSPEPARFDPTQGCDAVRTAMCYLSEQSKAASQKGESLWCGKGNGKQTSTRPALWSNANSQDSGPQGLWGGFCVNGGNKSPRGPTGILTPTHEKANPLSPCPSPAMSLLPPTPPASTEGTAFGTTDFSDISEKLAIEQTITEEFGDDFVTQVYNYLSLGYPSMARPFDTELSKISKIPVSELRQDDHLAESRGYIRLGKDGNLSDSEITEETCMRWRALRIYIQEWARQHPKMVEEDLPGGRGTAVRRGSWGF